MKQLLVILLLVTAQLQPVMAQQQQQKAMPYLACELHPDTFMTWVMNNHPVAQQADLVAERGAFAEQAARGGFDPTIMAEFDEKTLKETPYYEKLYTGFTVPTWYGVDVSIGYDQGLGAFLNPEDVTDQAGLWKAGVSIPLGQGLLIDKRRAVLKEAQLANDLSLAKREAMRLKLQLEAGKTYWKWFEAEEHFNIAVEAEELASARKQAIIRAIQFGDRPAVDSIEADVFIKDRTIARLGAERIREQARADINLYLWLNGTTPVEMIDCLRPVGRDEIQPAEIATAEAAPMTHPMIEQNTLKRDQLVVKRRLSAEALRPKVNFNYNLLFSPESNLELSREAVSNNSIWGISASMPLFLRSARGQVKMLDNDIRQQELEINNQFWNISLQLQQLREAVRLSGEQISGARNLVVSSDLLLDAEQQKFIAGESSLFLINSRELKLIESQQKLVKAIVENRTNQLIYRFFNVN